MNGDIDIRQVVAERIRDIWPSYPRNEMEVVQIAAESMEASESEVAEAIERVRRDEGAWGAAPYASKFRNRLAEITGKRLRKTHEAKKLKGFVWEEKPDGSVRRVFIEGGDGEPLNFGAAADRYGAEEAEVLEGAAERLGELVEHLRGSAPVLGEERTGPATFAERFRDELNEYHRLIGHEEDEEDESLDPWRSS